MIALDPPVVASALRNILHPHAPYGQLQWASKHFGISRPTLYRIRSTFLREVCRGPGRRCKSPSQRQEQAQQVQCQQKIVELQRQIEQIQARWHRVFQRVRFCLIARGLSARMIARLLRDCFDVPANRTDILTLTKQYAQRATELMKTHFWPLAQDIDLDEVFIEGDPLYIATDPQSLTIIKTAIEDERTTDAWSRFLQDLPNLTRTTSDRGQAILGALQKRGSLIHQSDTFHLKSLLHDELNVLEKRCYGLIAQEEDFLLRQNKTVSRGRDGRTLGRWCRVIKDKTAAAIAQFDELEQAIHVAFDALRLTTSQGTFNTSTQARESLDLSRLWICEYMPKGWNRVKSALQDSALFTFLDELHAALPSIHVDAVIPEDRESILVSLTRLWEWQAHRRYRGYPVEISPSIEKDLQTRCRNLPEVQRDLFRLLDSLHRASSAVECINSRVGFYRYSKRRFSTDFANLIAIWHNLTPFEDGKRAHQCPAHILGAKLPSYDIFELFDVA